MEALQIIISGKYDHSRKISLKVNSPVFSIGRWIAALKKVRHCEDVRGEENAAITLFFAAHQLRDLGHPWEGGQITHGVNVFSQVTKCKCLLRGYVCFIQQAANLFTCGSRCRRIELVTCYEKRSIQPLQRLIACINHGDQRVFFNLKHHKCLGYLFLIHLNTYVMDPRSLEIF